MTSGSQLGLVLKVSCALRRETAYLAASGLLSPTRPEPGDGAGQWLRNYKMTAAIISGASRGWPVCSCCTHCTESQHASALAMERALLANPIAQQRRLPHAGSLTALLTVPNAPGLHVLAATAASIPHFIARHNGSAINFISDLAGLGIAPRKQSPLPLESDQATESPEAIATSRSPPRC